MAEIITLSSSPAPIFARSPTPVRILSPPRRDTQKASSSEVLSHSSFEPAQARRDGFSSSYTAARQVLGPKTTVENVPLPSSDILRPKFDRLTRETSHGSPHPPGIHPTASIQSTHAVIGCNDKDLPDCTVVKVLPSDVRRRNKVCNTAPLNLRKATHRRKDWTPAKLTASNNGTTAASDFGMRLTKSFGHVNHDNTTPKLYRSADGTGAKRRKIDVLAPPSVTTSVNKPALGEHGKSASKSRNRSPVKKPLTITGLMTSHYADDDQGPQSATLMMQFLASTQARMQSAGDADTFESGITRKERKSKKPQSKTKLKSPQTSIRTLQEQEFIFASASQLLREESPTLLRDTVEATKNSEEDLFTDPVLTQQTAPISIESTSPKNGISRFLSRKNLWTAAHRDENNALLFRDDPFDDARVRALLAGKDTLVEYTANMPHSNDTLEDDPSLLASLNKGENTPCDIDNITMSPTNPPNPKLPTSTKRMYSTTSKSLSSRRSTAPSSPTHSARSRSLSRERSVEKVSIPPKPNYAIWTDEALKKQVQEYGLNRIRARATMIKRLDELWAQKYGLDPEAVKAATKRASKNVKNPDHGHFLSKVHELATRPSSKPKKPRGNASISKSQADPARRQSRSKLVSISRDVVTIEDSIIDIDDIDNTTAFDRLANIDPFEDVAFDVLEPSTAPVKGTGVQASTKSKAKRRTKAQELPLTPPATLPPDQGFPSSPGFESPRSTSPIIVSMTPASQNIPLELSLKDQIRTALLHPPPDVSRRNHQKNPTWHEKMLMYDPIVLEDFTAWLNTEGFNAIGVDDEIDAKDVKLWCEENGICCLWKGGWRGNKVKE